MSLQSALYARRAVHTLEASGQGPRDVGGGEWWKNGQPTVEPDSEIKLVRVQASGALLNLITSATKGGQLNFEGGTQGGHSLLLFTFTLARQAPETTAEILYAAC